MTNVQGSTLDPHDVVIRNSVTVLGPDDAPVLVVQFRFAPSPSYLDDDTAGYVGGMSDADVADLLGSLDAKHMAWASAMATGHVPQVSAPAETAQAILAYVGS